MTTSEITGDDPTVPAAMYGGDVSLLSSALANLARSQELPWDHPAQDVLLRRAQAYATLATG